MSPGLIILLILAVFLFLGFVGWCLVRFGTIGEADLDEPQGYVDQDGERTPARHQWVNAGAKAHHAEP